MTAGRPDRSMTLLREVVERPLDAGYAEAAERAARGEARTPSPVARVVVVVLAVVLGMGSVWAARELRAPTDSTTAARALLLTEIEARSERGDALRAANAEMVASIESLQASVLEGADGAFLDYLRLLGTTSGSAPVTGPGIVLTLDDSREAQEGVPGSEQGLVLDRDLQVVANALWASGAEAVAINGHRLTTLSAIRSAGRAILVDLAPLVRPYTVEAVGEPDEMLAGLARSTAGAHLALLRDTFGISVDMGPAEHLELPGSPSRTLRYAVRIAEPDDEPVPGATGRGN